MLAAASALSTPLFAADLDAEAGGAAETIIVTGERWHTSGGTKTDTPLIATPQAISIVPAHRFLDMGALNLQDALRYSAGVRPEAYGLDTRGDYGFIRGTSPGVYQDGLRRLFGGYRQGSKQEIFTLERLEIIRGPSSMLYGQGSTGGLINTITKKPQFGFGAQIFGSYGSFDRKEAGFDITGPIAGDSLAARLVGVWRDSDSQTDLVGEKRLVINPSLTWSPRPETDLTLLGLFQDDDSGWTGQFLPYVSTLLGDSAPNGRLPWDRQLGEPSVDRVDLNTENVTAQLVHRFSPHLRVRQNLRYEWFKSDQVLHYGDVYSSPTQPFVPASDPYLNQFFPSYATRGDNRILHRLAFGEVFRSKTLTSDSQMQADFATGPLIHKLLIGIDYARFRSRGTSAFAVSNAAPGAPGTTPIDAYDPVYGNLVPLTYFPLAPTRETQLGFYLQDEIRAFDRATVVLGLRRDRATNKAVGGTKFIDKAWTTRIGLLYDVVPGLTPYLSYSESFQPVVGTDFFGNPYKPTRGRQYEAGIKWQPDEATFATATFYDLKDSGRLISDPSNPLNQIQAGTIETKGVEIEAQRSIGESFDVIASYSYTRAKDQSIATRGRVTTNQVESIPKHLASIWAMKQFDLADDVSLRLGGGARYVSTSWSVSFDSSFAPFTLATPDYLLFDALLGVDYGPWRASLNATNLFDKRYYTTCLGRGDCFLGLRRTVNLRIGYSF